MTSHPLANSKSKRYCKDITEHLVVFLSFYIIFIEKYTAISCVARHKTNLGLYIVLEYIVFSAVYLFITWYHMISLCGKHIRKDWHFKGTDLRLGQRCIHRLLGLFKLGSRFFRFCRVHEL